MSDNARNEQSEPSRAGQPDMDAASVVKRSAVSGSVCVITKEKPPSGRASNSPENKALLELLRKAFELPKDARVRKYPYWVKEPDFEGSAGRYWITIYSPTDMTIPEREERIEASLARLLWDRVPEAWRRRALATNAVDELIKHRAAAK